MPRNQEGLARIQNTPVPPAIGNPDSVSVVRIVALFRAVIIWHCLCLKIIISVRRSSSTSAHLEVFSSVALSSFAEHSLLRLNIAHPTNLLISRMCGEALTFPLLRSACTRNRTPCRKELTNKRTKSLNKYTYAFLCSPQSQIDVVFCKFCHGQASCRIQDFIIECHSIL
jgi:hypothetical protein